MSKPPACSEKDPLSITIREEANGKLLRGVRNSYNKSWGTQPFSLKTGKKKEKIRRRTEQAA